MSAGARLWTLVQSTLSTDANVSALVDGVYDKVPTSPFRGREAYISRGPISGLDDGADGIDGQELTLQLDIWSRRANRWSCDDIVGAVRDALHDRALDFPDDAAEAVADLRVTLTRVIDDPDPLTVHGVVQVTALIERVID